MASPPDWNGWVIRLKNWHAPLYAQAEMPPRHIAWTGDRDKALGFRKKRDAIEFLERLGELPEQCELRFIPWKRRPESENVPP